MFSQLNYCILLILIVFSFTSTNVSAVVTCDYYQTSCYSSTYGTWCCPNPKYCGYSYGSCLYYTTPTPSADLPPATIFAIIFFPAFTCALCISYCLRAQRQQQLMRSDMANTNARTSPYPYQQQPARGSTRAGRIQPVYNVSAAPSVYSIYEAPPPSYEASITDPPPKYSSAPLPSATPTVEATYLRV